MPAIRWSRVNTLTELHGGDVGVRRLLRTAGLWWLIPWQVALGTVLLASAGVLSTTVRQLMQGIEASSPERVWFADVTSTLSTPARVRRARDPLRRLSRAARHRRRRADLRPAAGVIAAGRCASKA